MHGNLGDQARLTYKAKQAIKDAAGSGVSITFDEQAILEQEEVNPNPFTRTRTRTLT